MTANQVENYYQDYDLEKARYLSTEAGYHRFVGKNDDAVYYIRVPTDDRDPTIIKLFNI